VVIDDFSPMVFAALITKEFAPLQNTNIKKIAVGIDPELIPKYRLPLPPTSLVKS
jgi:hypothetical protein